MVICYVFSTVSFDEVEGVGVVLEVFLEEGRRRCRISSSVLGFVFFNFRGSFLRIGSFSKYEETEVSRG